MTVIHRLCNRFVATLAFVAMLASALGPASSQPAAPPAPTLWPLSYQSNGGTVVVYEPQVRKLTNYTELDAAAVVALTLPGAAAPVYGVVNFTSLVSANATTDTVTFVNAKANSSHWQNPAASTALDAFARANVQLQGHALPLATVLASIGRPATPPKTVPVHTAPPTIFVSQKKSILVVIDGQPAMAPVKQTRVHYVANTNWPIFQDPTSSHYYLLDKKGWLSAPAVAGPWVGDVAPASWLAKVPNTAEYADVRTKLSAPMMPAADVPKVFVSMTPADLLAFDGPPQFANIPGTQLRYVANTTNDVFFSRDTTVWYVLLAGRWYAAANLNGPWAFATPHLPADFRKIPPDNPRARVLVSVPGTNASIFAASAANVPHLQPLDPAKTKLTVAYAPGAPKFEPIAGTPLQRAVNTSVDVVKVDEKLYFACHNAVWFTASSATGPWTVATYVPDVIYTIPPSSPLYHDTYVYVYNAQGQVMHKPPAPRPEQTYEKFAASQISNGDIAAGYTGYAMGYIGGYYGTGGGYVVGTGYYTPGYYNGGVWYANPRDVRYVRPDDVLAPARTGTERRRERQQRALRSEREELCAQRYEAPPVDATPRLHTSPTATRPDNNVYAGADNGVYRNQSGAWQSLGTDGAWAPISAAPPSVLKDYHVPRRWLQRARDVAREPIPGLFTEGRRSPSRGCRRGAR